jgi:GR25 family glycosyltransferase involved in LPS biosynthesis
MTIENYFDKIYIINLKRSPERRNNMISQMKKYNITNFIFLPTIDGKYLDKNKLKENNEWAYPGNKLCNNTCSCGGKGHNLSAGQISLHINHYNIWQDMVKNNYKKCLILEDDCIFTEYFENLENDIKFIPENWELLYLGHSQKIRSFNTKEKNIKFKKLIRGVNETHIYGVSLEGVRILIEHTYPIRAAVDGYLTQFMINNRVLQNIYISKTSYAKNGSLKKIFKTTL